MDPDWGSSNSSSNSGSTEEVETMLSVFSSVLILILHSLKPQVVVMSDYGRD
jgi:hypothetical protein